MNQAILKKKAAEAALAYVKGSSVIGVGTGSTVAYFIEALQAYKGSIEATVASSKQSELLLKQYGLPVMDLNVVGDVDVYVDGADEVTAHKQMIKGGGGALTSEKIIASVAKQFVCIVDQSKCVDVLGTFPVAVEVLPMARGYVARQILKLGADPVYREGFRTDRDNIILDIYNLDCADPGAQEDRLNQITGVVENGLFAHRRADHVLVADKAQVRSLA
jgi:ribose 5-phosphate isomerase A